MLPTTYTNVHFFLQRKTAKQCLKRPMKKKHRSKQIVERRFNDIHLRSRKSQEPTATRNNNQPPFYIWKVVTIAPFEMLLSLSFLPAETRKLKVQIFLLPSRFREQPECALRASSSSAQTSRRGKSSTLLCSPPLPPRLTEHVALIHCATGGATSAAPSYL